MGTTPAQHTVIDVDDYLAGERESEVRHEYVAGQVYPVSADRNPRLFAADPMQVISAMGRRNGCPRAGMDRF
jgi:hypothetical protein